jgi:hypothetical protein
MRETDQRACEILSTTANTISDRNMELKDNTIIVVLGASGDLAKKKTVCKEANI